MFCDDVNDQLKWEKAFNIESKLLVKQKLQLYLLMFIFLYKIFYLNFHSKSHKAEFFRKDYPNGMMSKSTEFDAPCYLNLGGRQLCHSYILQKIYFSLQS